MVWLHALGIGSAIVVLVAALVGFLGIVGRLPDALLKLGRSLAITFAGGKTAAPEDKALPEG